MRGCSGTDRRMGSGIRGQESRVRSQGSGVRIQPRLSFLTRGLTMLTVERPHSAEDKGGDPSQDYIVRVLHISVDKIFGGIESSLLTIGRFAPAVPTLVPLFALCFEGRLSKELSELGVTAHSLGGVRTRWPWTIWRARRRLSKLIEKDRPDIAICHSSWPHA